MHFDNGNLVKMCNKQSNNVYFAEKIRIIEFQLNKFK